ncbi:8-oxo-dGTP pyrophosphatase MutT, NUDIX family [Belliella buryatensis]|uniref:8-oxo-dGTP pyrophosphatase MutT, NUDIX family n=1 Tax=Belliella buryatensis TaxID=1500549 RepID=A0A239BB72_9BACT|nr:NUDIX hydrolase [Belliella buryatensis]SNS04811.1 8-oxo-dGTP pyrophosphatase MutT, NUDIX family [Belliella buryatensis]
MDRILLRQSLENYRTPFEEESAFVSEFIALTFEQDAFLRSRLSGHFTASAWVVNKRRTHTLLTLHRKLNRWLQLGGHADGEENLLEVAMKEAQEESGLTSLRFVGNGIFDIDKHIIPQKGDVPEHYHYDVRYLIEAELNEPLTLSSESMDLAWVPFDTVEDVIGYNPSILRMLEKTSRSEYVI